MMYLSGKVVSDLPAMLTPRMGQQPPPGQPWAADTGCFANPGAHDDDRYLAWLSSMPLDRCLFATAPDRFDDGAGTLLVATPMLPRLRELGVPAALVAHMGMTVATVPWDLLDVLFIGGSNRWQHSDTVRELVAEAHRLNKRVHVGRVNGWSRFSWAASLGADSVDGTVLAFGPTTNRAYLDRWQARLEREPSLWRRA